MLLLLCSGCEPAKQSPDEDEARILFGGDTSFGESYHSVIGLSGGSSVLDDGDYERPLSALAPLMTGADFVLLNLETPLTDLQHSPLEGKKVWVHWSDPRRAPATLRQHNVRAVSLANNHTMDFGLPGLRQTLDALEAAGIDAFGAGENAAEAARPLRGELAAGSGRFRFAVIAAFEFRLDYATDHEFYARRDRGGVNRLSDAALGDQIARLKADDPSVFVIVWPHWGQNYGDLRPQEIDAARRAVDAGADLVIGHGAHTIQPVERYRDRWILYNIGNFMFNAPGRYARHGAAPFGLAVSLVVREEQGHLRKVLRCYPLLTDNRRTGYRPRPVTKREFGEVQELIAGWNAGAVPVSRAADAAGLYFELPLEP